MNGMKNRHPVLLLGMAVALVFAGRDLAGLDDCALPAAQRLSDFDWGASDGERACLKGYLRRVTGKTAAVTEAEFACADGVFRATLPGPLTKWEPLLGCGFELCGRVRGSRLLPARLGLRLDVAAEADALLVEELPANPFAVREVPLGELHARPEGEMPDGRPVRVRGVVTCVRQGEFFTLQSGGTAVRVEVSRSEPLAVGDLADAVGFPELETSAPRFQAILYRSLAHSCALPEGVAVRSAPDAVRVGLVGRFEGYEVSPGGVTTLRLEADGDSVSASWPGGMPEELTGDFRWRPLVAVTGVLERVRGRTTLLLDGPRFAVTLDDEARARRRRQRLRVAGAWAALASLAALVALLEAARRRRRVMDSIAQERKRMADDLHDTIEQHMAGAGMLLKLARRPANGLKPTTEALVKEAQDVLLRAKQEMRDVVWGLKNDDMMRLSPAEMLRQVAHGETRGGVMRVRTRLKGLPARLDAAVMRDLSLIVREAIGNAMKHGGATKVAIVADPGKAGGFVLRIANNGRKFDPAAVPGPAQGHFGLEGMRERARRCAFSLGFETAGKWMVVRLEGGT